ncbi:hypothetical protein M513_03258 [Trichuris suis]|uniref:Uncharacterized protein n=1 Tax=Trichuris suis TaxID=68888 RepID=A0A085MF23_9BILA|nr:hypothetical protein M513_03258 [Trichuris suis]
MFLVVRVHIFGKGAPNNGELSKGRPISHLSMDSFVKQVPFLLHRGEYVKLGELENNGFYCTTLMRASVVPSSPELKMNVR